MQELIKDTLVIWDTKDAVYSKFLALADVKGIKLSGKKPSKIIIDEAYKSDKKLLKDLKKTIKYNGLVITNKGSVVYKKPAKDLLGFK